MMHLEIYLDFESMNDVLIRDLDVVKSKSDYFANHMPIPGLGSQWSFLHLSLHFFHEIRHSLLDFWVILGDIERHTGLKLLAAHSFLEEKCVISASLLNRHVDHKFHLVCLTRGCDALHLCLLAKSIYCVPLVHLECLQNLLLAEFWLLLCLTVGILVGKFAILCSHEHLHELILLCHSLHGHSELLLICICQHLHELLHDLLRHLVILLDLFLNQCTVFIILLVLV